MVASCRELEDRLAKEQQALLNMRETQQFVDEERKVRSLMDGYQAKEFVSGREQNLQRRTKKNTWTGEPEAAVSEDAESVVTGRSQSETMPRSCRPGPGSVASSRPERKTLKAHSGGAGLGPGRKGLLDQAHTVIAGSPAASRRELQKRKKQPVVEEEEDLSRRGFFAAGGGFTHANVMALGRAPTQMLDPSKPGKPSRLHSLKFRSCSTAQRGREKNGRHNAGLEIWWQHNGLAASDASEREARLVG